LSRNELGALVDVAYGPRRVVDRLEDLGLLKRYTMPSLQLRCDTFSAALEGKS
jgi:hypothetical protein